MKPREVKRPAKLSRNGTDKPKRSNYSQPEKDAPDRSPPHSIEAEHGVLGSMLVNPRDAIGECVERGMTTDYFFVPAHQTIYDTLVELWRERKTFDLIIFTQILRDRKLLDTVGGPSFVTSLYTSVPTAANVSYYAEILRDKYILRQIIAASTESIERAFDDQDQVNELLSDVERRTLEIRPAESHRQQTIKDSVMEAIEGIERLYETKGAVTGLATGFADLDRMTSGLQPQDMIVLAGRPSMGKTALGMNIAEHVAVNLGIPVLVFSLEMSTQQLVQRLVCSRARVNLQKVRDGFLSQRDFPAITTASSKIMEAPLHIIDERLYIDALVARARRMKVNKGIKFIVVDYLQLLRARGFKADQRQQEVSYISGALKGLAKELHIPVLVLAQLNREPERRGGGKPRLSDLRESGAIEQDADLVGLLVRGEIYAEDEEERHEKAGEAELIIGKQRNGPIGEVALTFFKEYTRFEDRARAIQGSLV